MRSANNRGGPDGTMELIYHVSLLGREIQRYVLLFTLGSVARPVRRRRRRFPTVFTRRKTKADRLNSFSRLAAGALLPRYAISDASPFPPSLTGETLITPLTHERP